MTARKNYILGIVLAFVILAVDIIFLTGSKIFYFLVGISCLIFALPFVLATMTESRREKESNEMFLEFSRNLAESVKAGTPISKSIINLRNKNYGALTPNVRKLANQISLGISLKEAFEVFSKDVNSRTISRAVTLISEAEKAGGEIESILESVASSVSETEKLKKERKSAIYNLLIQGYIIFFVFVAIMLIIQFKIMPMTSDIARIGTGLDGFVGLSKGLTPEDASKPMFYLLLVQGFFIGLVIGKVAEGSFKAGIKHSFAMLVLSILIYTGANAFF